MANVPLRPDDSAPDSAIDSRRIQAISGGVDLSAQGGHTRVGGDVTGRDKIVSAGDDVIQGNQIEARTYIEHATIVTAPPVVARPGASRMWLYGALGALAIFILALGVVRAVTIQPTSGMQTPVPRVLFSDGFDGLALDPVYQAALPDAIFRAGSENAIYLGAPDYTLESLSDQTVIVLTNQLSDMQRRGWSTSANFTVEPTSMIRLEVRFNTLLQTSSTGIDQLLEVWLLDATNLNRYDKVTIFAFNYGANRMFAADSSITGLAVDNTFPFKDNSWYRVLITGSTIQAVRVAVYADTTGTELIGMDLGHNLSTYTTGFKIGISQSLGHPMGTYPTSVAVDWIKLTSSANP